MPIYEVFQEMEYVLQDHPDWSEETITDYFLSILSKKSNRIQYRKFKKHEEGVNGADWEWWFLTSEALLKFYVQAKKINADITKKILLYRTKNSEEYQIDKLIDSSEKDNALPLYAFYSENTLPTICDKTKHDECYKAVYLASANDLRNNINNLDNKKFINPMSCFFKFSDCSVSTDTLCVCCNECEELNSCEIFEYDDNCIHKMIILLQQFNLQKIDEDSIGLYKVLPEHIAIFHYANSILKNKIYREKFFREYSNAIKVSNIVITDYLNRHEAANNAAILGVDNIYIDDEIILDKKDIIYKIGYLIDKHPVIKAIGLFGSYAKDTADVLSDIDLMLLYNLKEIEKNGFKPIVYFLKETVEIFVKSIDFIDYKACGAAFKKAVKEDIIWIK